MNVEPARTSTSVSPRPLTFALPTVTTEKRSAPPAAASPTFLNRLSRRISQSGAHLKRKVSKGGKGPVRRASEADKENRSGSADIIANEQAEKRDKAEAEIAERTRNSDERERTRKTTLKRGLRVSVMRRTKSEGAPGTSLVRRDRGGEHEQEKEKLEELAPVAPIPANENDSEVSSHRGSYFYSTTLGVCWDGRERVHPDAFAFKAYSSDADVLPSPVVASNRIVYASTLSSFPPRPPLRPRTPPQLTPASLIAAEYRALHPKTPSICSDSEFEDFDLPPDLDPPSSFPGLESLPLVPPPPPLLASIDTGYITSRLYSASRASSTASSRHEPLTPGLSEDSSTSLETLARAPIHFVAQPPGVASEEEQEEDQDDEATRVQTFIAPKGIPRFSLVDSGPITLNPKPSLVFSEGSSTIDIWRDCED